MADELCSEFPPSYLPATMYARDRSKVASSAPSAIEGTHVFGDFSANVTACQSALAQNPSNPDLTLRYAQTLILQTEFVKARTVLHGLIEQMGPSVRRLPVALRLYGVLLSGEFLAGKPDDVAPYYKQAADLGDEVAALLYADWLLHAGRPEDEYKPFLERAASSGLAPAGYEIYILSSDVVGKFHGLSRSDRFRVLDVAAKAGYVPAMNALLDGVRDGAIPSDQGYDSLFNKWIQQLEPHPDRFYYQYFYEFG